MKRKILLTMCISALLVCLLCIAISASGVPDVNGETFTLTDGTTLPIWDTDGNGLVWFKSTNNVDDGYADYDCISNNQKDNTVYPYIQYSTWSGNVNGSNNPNKGYQATSFKISDSVDGTVKEVANSNNSTIVLANMQGAMYDANNLFNCYNSTFKNAKSLEAVWLDKNAQFLVTFVFNNCSVLRYTNISETAITYCGGQGTFAECTSLKEINLPSTVTVVGRWQFQNTGITEFTIPSGVTAWEDTNFKNCASLKRVYGFDKLFENGVLTSIPTNTFLNCSQLEYVFPDGVFPSEITKIEASAFQGCSKLGPNIILPNTLTEIGQCSFIDCKSIEKVVLGSSFSTWSSYDGFKNCSSLKEVYIPATMTSIAGNVFNAAASDCVFYFTGTKEQLDTVKANANSNNSAFHNAYNQAVSFEEFKAIETKSGRYIVYEYSECIAFNGGAHQFVASGITYPNGFDNKGSFISACQLCSETGIEEAGAMITSLGYAYNTAGNGALILAGGFNVDAELVSLYESFNNVDIEIGVLFSSAENLMGDKPTSLEEFNHFSDGGANDYSTYDYKVRFPSPTSESYERFLRAEFVTSAFIFDGASYFFYQNNDENTTTSVLDNGFTATTLERILAGDKVLVTYDVGTGYFENSSDYTDIIEVGGVLSSLPVPMHTNPSMVFEGWYTDAEYTSLVSLEDVYYENTTLYAKWTMEGNCAEGETPHTYENWELTSSTCTTPQSKTSTCVVCGNVTTVVDESAPGHIWSSWQIGFFNMERSCTRSGCQDVQSIDIDNITSALIESKSFSGQAWGSVDGLFNKDWDDNTIAAKGCDLSLELILKAPTAIDRIYVKGHGQTPSKFAVYVLYDGDGDYVSLGNGSFLTNTQNSDTDNRQIPYVQADSSKKVISVKIDITNSSYGSDYWEEIAFLTIPDAKNSPSTEKVTVKYYTDLGYFENDFDGERFVPVGTAIPSHPTPVYKDSNKLFAGWYVDSTYTTPVAEGDIYNTDATLYARWIDNTTCSDGTNNHNYESWTVITPSTCSTKGVKTAACTICGKEAVESIDFADHTETVVEGIAPNCTEMGLSDEVVCFVCGEHISGGEILPPNGEHVYNESAWVTVSTATKYTNGIATNTCTVCSESDEKKLDRLATDEELSKIDVGIKYTGGSYENEIFSNIAPLGRVYVTSYFAGTSGSYAIDKNYKTFWNADTYADGADYAADYIELELPASYEIGVITLTIPYYSSYELGDDCYVSYGIEYWNETEGKWTYLGTVSDKDSTPVGTNCEASLVLDTPVSAQKLRASVQYAGRYTPAVIYELEVFAKANSFDYDVESVVGQANASISGKYNDWVSGAEAFVDGNLDTGWLTDIRHGGPTWAILEFSEDTYVSCVQIAIKTSSIRKFTVEVMENGEWIALGDTYAATGTVGGNIISNANGISIFNIDVEKSITQIKLSIVSDPGYWECYVYEITPYAIVDSVNDSATKECKHIVLTKGEVVAPTCTEAGYTIMVCSSCQAQLKTQATDMLSHSFGEYSIVNAATSTAMGTKSASCERCEAVSTIKYEADYEAPVITPYLHNAPAAWAMTFDDGNYTDTYNWVVPMLEKYGYKATVMMSITYADALVSQWQNHFSRGVFDLGSHSYYHTSIYNGEVYSDELIGEVINAQYWFRHNFHSQRVLTFAAPLGTTSDAVADYLTGPFVANRNGGDTGIFYNTIQQLSSKLVWGDLNSYISKADQTEGTYVFINKSGGTYKQIDSSTYEWVLNGSYDANGNFCENQDGGYAYLRNPYGEYVFVKQNGMSYVYDDSLNTFVEKDALTSGTYFYDAENYKYTLCEAGSYNYNITEDKFEFVEGNGGEYLLVKTSVGSYESAIDTLISNNGFTVECIHSLHESRESISGVIHSSYVSTISKFEYLAKRGVWAPSYNQLVQYLKEAQRANVETVSRTGNGVTISVTDDLDNYMFDQALTVKVDIPDGWKTITVQQNGVVIPLVSIEEYKASKNMSARSCAVEDGYIYIDVIPDGGNVVISGAEATLTENDEDSADVSVSLKDLLGN